MTEDELRAECQVVLTLTDIEIRSRALNLLVRFANRMQAVGLREAGEHFTLKWKFSTIMEFRKWCEAQAKEREQ